MPAFLISRELYERRDVSHVVMHLGALITTGCVMGSEEWLNQCRIAGVTKPIGKRFRKRPAAHITGTLVGPVVLKFYIELDEVDHTLEGYPPETIMYTVKPGWPIEKL